MRTLAPTFTNPPSASDAEKVRIREYREAARKAAVTRRANAEKMRTLKMDPRVLERLDTDRLRALRDFFTSKKNTSAAQAIAGELYMRKAGQ